MAVASDGAGNSTTLGTKTIWVDNEHAVKPFGAIDTPAQGGVASGSSYVNMGWALTPQPNRISTSGSAIGVWVDGQYAGSATYGAYREDIATLFPGYANSEGAQAYPIVGATWILAYDKMANEAKAEILKAWLTWALEDGGDLAGELGYAPLSEELRSLALEKVDSITSLQD